MPNPTADRINTYEVEIVMDDDWGDPHRLVFISYHYDYYLMGVRYHVLCSNRSCNNTVPNFINAGAGINQDDGLRRYAQRHINDVNQRIYRAKEENEAIEHAYRIGFC